MYVTGFGATKLRNEKPDDNIRRSCLQTRARNVRVIVTHHFTKEYSTS